MADDTDRLPELPEEFDEHAETIVLDEADLMDTRELRQLLDAEAEASARGEPDDCEP